MNWKDYRAPPGAPVDPESVEEEEEEVVDERRVRCEGCGIEGDQATSSVGPGDTCPYCSGTIHQVP